jgi:hypothetical protein
MNSKHAPYPYKCLLRRFGPSVGSYGSTYEQPTRVSLWFRQWQRKENSNAFDQDQGGQPTRAVISCHRRAEARLAKHGSETSTGADLPTR